MILSNCSSPMHQGVLPPRILLPFHPLPSIQPIDTSLYRYEGVFAGSASGNSAMADVFYKFSKAASVLSACIGWYNSSEAVPILTCFLRAAWQLGKPLQEGVSVFTLGEEYRPEFNLGKTYPYSRLCLAQLAHGESLWQSHSIFHSCRSGIIGYLVAGEGHSLVTILSLS